MADRRRANEPAPPEFIRKRVRVNTPSAVHPAGDEETVISPDRDDHHTTTTTTLEICGSCGAAIHEPKEVGGVWAASGPSTTSTSIGTNCLG